MHHWRAVALLGTCFVAGCGSSGGSAQPPSRATPVAPDTSSFDVTWKPETVVLDAGDVAAVVRNPRAPDGIYDFDPASEMVKNLQPGQVLVLTGVDLVRVTQVDAQPDSVRVTTEPASLLDAATDVHADWDIGADHRCAHCRLAGTEASCCRVRRRRLRGTALDASQSLPREPATSRAPSPVCRPSRRSRRPAR